MINWYENIYNGIRSHSCKKKWWPQSKCKQDTITYGVAPLENVHEYFCDRFWENRQAYLTGFPDNDTGLEIKRRIALANYSSILWIIWYDAQDRYKEVQSYEYTDKR